MARAVSMPQTASSFERFIRLPLSGYNGVDAVGRGARQLENNAVRQADRDLSGTGKPSGSHADLIRTVRRLHHGRFAREHDHVMSVEIDGTVGHVGQLDPLDEFIILPDLGVQRIARSLRREKCEHCPGEQQHRTDNDKIAPFHFTAHRYTPCPRR